MNELDPAYAIRPFVETDRRFVAKTWRESFWRARSIDKMDHGRYWRSMWERANALIDAGVVVIVCSADDVDTIVGWACASKDGALHYVFVREDFRGDGLGRALVAALPLASPVIYTHRSRWLRKAPSGWIYDPLKAA